MFWKIRGERLDCSKKILMMGILNITPDSFSDGGRFFDPSEALRRAFDLAGQGADILDLGAESTRPGADLIPASEEARRILPVLEGILQKIRIPVSIDTTKPEIARLCLEKGAHIINDVSALRDSGSEMAELVRRYGAGLILMHRRGRPWTMQSLAVYEDVVAEVCQELAQSLEMALEAGLEPEQIVVDPGLGFAKTFEHNIEIMRRLETFQTLGRPVLLGPSRKSFIGKVTGREAAERDFGTAGVAAIAVMKGIRLLRVHEVSGARDAVAMAEAIRGEDYVRTL